MLWTDAETKRTAVQRYKMLFLLAYVYLLRVPSEGIPVVKGQEGLVPQPPVMIYRRGKLCTVVGVW